MLPEIGKYYRAHGHRSKPIIMIINVTKNDRYCRIKCKTIIGYPNILLIQLAKDTANDVWDKNYEHVPEDAVLAILL